ncbi:hypothetical protein CLU79DRAFT_727243 [Phycomyces nitens]|nr:hypothetical protein CLU79DRAFT_727243 [Phycomyces nitens]
MEPTETLTHICLNNICHCDWRLSIKNCVESSAFNIINIINIVISGGIIIVGIALLIDRLAIKKYTLWNFDNHKGCLRPKPVECMLLLLMIFNILRLISSIVLVVDIAPTNLIFRSWLFEIPWQFGYGGFALYLIGISQALADSHKSLASAWIPSTRLVDIAGTWFFVWPFVINNICSTLGGGMAYTNPRAAEIFTRLLYLFWFTHNSSLTLAVVYTGNRLVNILENHSQTFNASGARYVSIKAGIFKIKAIIGIIGGCLMTFATFLLLYGALRPLIIKSFAGNVALGIIWIYLGPLATVCVELAIIINPTIPANQALNIKSSNNEKSRESIENNTIQKDIDGTKGDDNQAIPMTNFNEVEQQQKRYQSVVQKYTFASNTSLHNSQKHSSQSFDKIPATEMKISMSWNQDEFGKSRLGDDNLGFDVEMSSRLGLIPSNHGKDTY